MDFKWKRLETQLDQAFEAIAAFDAAARRDGHKPVLASVADVRSCAARAAHLLRHRPRKSDGWKAWVDAETAWLETRSAINGLAARPGPLRDAYLASVRSRVERAETEISGLLARLDLFRPRTRLAISKEADRLRRMLGVLREEADRLGRSGGESDGLAAQGVGQVWSDIAWAVEETKARFARPRWRTGHDNTEHPVLAL
jgi:hypothetical protein